MSLTDLTDLTKVFVDPTAYADEERFHAACRVLRREHPVVQVESERYRPFWELTPEACAEEGLRAMGCTVHETTGTVVHESLGPHESAPSPAAPAPLPYLINLWDEGDANSQPFDSMGRGDHIDQSPTVFVVDSGGIVRALFEGPDARDLARIEAAARRLQVAGTAAATSLR